MEPLLTLFYLTDTINVDDEKTETTRHRVFERKVVFV